MHHDTFSFMMAYLAMVWFCISRKGGAGGGRWEGTNSMAVSGLAHEKPLVVWSRVGWTGTGLWVVGESN